MRERVVLVLVLVLFIWMVNRVEGREEKHAKLLVGNFPHVIPGNRLEEVPHANLVEEHCELLDIICVNILHLELLDEFKELLKAEFSVQQQFFFLRRNFLPQFHPQILFFCNKSP